MTSENSIDTRPPIKAIKVATSYSTKEWKYYKSIRQEIPLWWIEFRAVKSEGGYEYPSVKSFILSKTKNKQEQKWLMDMIGPEPESNDVKMPWLGDWYEIRLALRVLPVKADNVEMVIRSSFGTPAESVLSMRPLTAYMIARHLREFEQLDEIFAGQLFDPKFTLTSEETKKRFDLYLQFYDAVSNRIENKIHLMQELNGLTKTDEGMQVVQFNQVNQQANIEVPQGSSELPKKELELLKLARTLQYHSDRLKLPLSQKLSETPVEIKGEEVKPKDKLQ